ncbi:MAG: Smr/MutS family protein, partial [Chloroflexota bacterium]|nr:Smr/MutS family protein [Chloroflexota bacterium]
AEGDVLTAPDSGGAVEVQLGAFKLRVRMDDMERARPSDDGGWTWSAEDGPRRTAAADGRAAGSNGAPAWGTEEVPRRAGRPEFVTAASLQQRASAAAVPLELDLRGFRAEEIEDAVDPYLQEAALAGMPLVRIIHGKGTGVLRQVVRDLLKRHPLVRAWAPGPLEQGGEGVTLAYFS